MFMYMLFVFILVSIIYMIFVIISFKQEKEMMFVSSYECGFEPYSEVRIFFSYRFFLLAILFLVFDVEIVLFLISPFILIENYSVFVMLLFLMILIFGLMYEWTWGSLNWL